MTEPVLVAAAKIDLPGLVCADVAIIIVVARAMGWLFNRIRQPAVIGEIIGGILLGPSVLGLLPGHLDAHLFPATALPTLNVLAQLGIAVFVFIVGLEVDLGLIRGRRRVAATVSLSSVALPFGLGAAAALLLHEQFSHVGSHEVRLLSFALFIGATMSVTAFPVLARVLSERHMLGTELGSFVLACAAMDDVLAWTILAVVIGIIRSSSDFSFLRIVLELAAFVVAVLFGVRPALRWLFERDRRHGSLSLNTLAATLVGTLLSAWVTDKIGINLIFGAFLFGAAVPKRGAESLVASIVERLESAILLLLLPIFFVVAGLSVDFRTLVVGDLPYLVLILAVAIGGKFFGAAVAARLQGVTRRRAMAVGTLMNTRGLTELVILTIGLTLGVLDTRLYTLMVVMAVLTTLMTAPMLRKVYPDRLLQADIAEAQERLGSGSRYGVLVLLNEVDDPAPLTSLGVRLAGAGGKVLLARLLAHPSEQPQHADLSGSLLRMAAAVEALNSLAATYPEVAVSPIAQLSTDVEADMTALIARTGVNATVVGGTAVGDAGAAARLCGEAAVDLVTLRPGAAGNPVMGVISGDSVDGAVLEVSARLVLSESSIAGGTPAAPLVLCPQRPSERNRTRRFAERLQSLGLEVLVEQEPAGTELVVRGWSGHDAAGAAMLPASGVAFVYSNEDPERVGVDQRLLRLDALRRVSTKGEAAGVATSKSVGAEL